MPAKGTKESDAIVEKDLAAAAVVAPPSVEDLNAKYEFASANAADPLAQEAFRECYRDYRAAQAPPVAEVAPAARVKAKERAQVEREEKEAEVRYQASGEVWRK
jgi:hypothetical protein